MVKVSTGCRVRREGSGSWASEGIYDPREFDLADMFIGWDVCPFACIGTLIGNNGHGYLGQALSFEAVVVQTPQYNSTVYVGNLASNTVREYFSAGRIERLCLLVEWG